MLKRLSRLALDSLTTEITLKKIFPFRQYSEISSRDNNVPEKLLSSDRFRPSSVTDNLKGRYHIISGCDILLSIHDYEMLLFIHEMVFFYE